jgi:hypothetical protein
MPGSGNKPPENPQVDRRATKRWKLSWGETPFFVKFPWATRTTIKSDVEQRHAAEMDDNVDKPIDMASLSGEEV